jgi:hypothetical protein
MFSHAERAHTYMHNECACICDPRLRRLLRYLWDSMYTRVCLNIYIYIYTYIHTCTYIHVCTYIHNDTCTCRLLQQLHERHHSGQQMVRTANEMKKVVEALERLNDYMLGHIRYEEEVTMPWLRKVDTTSAIAV